MIETVTMAKVTSPGWQLALANAWWEEPSTLWLALGLALILAEIVIPQIFVIFLGVGAITVSGALHMGWVSTSKGAVACWIAASAALLWGLRDVLIRLAPTCPEPDTPPFEQEPPPDFEEDD